MTKENIKKFFKPSGKKILLTFLMCFIVFGIVNNIPIASDTYTYSTSDQLIINLYCPPCKIFIHCVELITGADIADTEDIILLIPFIIMFAYYYFFSCLAVFLFNKIFGKIFSRIYNKIRSEISIIFSRIKRKIDSMISESIKRFFRSSPVKKSLFLLLSILFFMPVLTMNPASLLPYPILYLAYLPVFVVGYIMQLSPVFDNISSNILILGWIVMIVVIFAYWYFLSCLTVFLFNKFFGKTVKRIDAMISESTKQFFKLNRRKALLFISITYIIPSALLLIISSFDIDFALFLEIYFFPFSLVFKYSLTFPFNELISNELIGVIKTGLIFIFVILMIIYYYSLSCLLAFYLNKTFNKITRKIDSMVSEKTKRFLKPDRKKILLFFLILFFAPTSTTTDSSLILLISHPFLSIISYFKLHESTSVIALIGWLMAFIFLVLELAYYYFLSCLTVFLYRKIKGKK